MSAQGWIGQGLKNEKMVDAAHNQVMFATSDINGRVTRTATIHFNSLSELTLSDEIMSLTVTGRDLFGLGPTHVAFRSISLVDKARNARSGDSNEMSEQIAQSILGDHTYSFSVTVPGSIERIAPLTLGNQTYIPQVTGDFYHGHTVTWRVPLYALVSTRAVNVEVDFVAYGLFADATTKLAYRE
jgi:hypothetical protein